MFKGDKIKMCIKDSHIIYYQCVQYSRGFATATAIQHVTKKIQSKNWAIVFIFKGSQTGGQSRPDSAHAL